MVTPSEDIALREASINWLRDRTHDGLHVIHGDELSSDFYFRGERRPLKNRQMGIHSSRGFRAAWSITTTFVPDGKDRPYDDAAGADGLLRYKWEKEDPENKSNRALRKAMGLRLPLIWFWGVAPSLYKAIFPVYLLKEEPEKKQFIVDTDGLQNLESAGEDPGELLKGYREEAVRKRIHQPAFRERVLRAYQMRCAICGMPRAELLDAAHIVPDKEPDGVASVPNGLALCKIHHSAYDSDLLGVTPDRQVVVQQEILDGIDGPIFEHGLKGVDGQSPRFLPTQKALYPDPSLLALKYEDFLTRPKDSYRPPDLGLLVPEPKNSQVKPGK